MTFSKAAEHGWRAPVTQAAFDMLTALLCDAAAAGFTSSACSLSSSIRQQLQQSGMLTQLSALMTAMAADLLAEAAELAAGGGDAASARDVDRLVSTVFNPVVCKAMLCYADMMDLWLSGAQSVSVGAIAWLCHPSGHAAAAMQLHTAALQHVSAVVQHLLPAVRQRDPQQADTLLRHLSAAAQAPQAAPKMMMLVAALSHAVCTGQGYNSASGSLLQLLQTPDMPPYLATVVVLYAARCSQGTAVDSNEMAAAGSSSSGSGSSRRSSSSGSDTGNWDRQRQGGTSSSSEAAVHAFTACELQLLQRLGLAPEVVAWLQPQCSLEDAAAKLRTALTVCTICCKAGARRVPGETSTAGQQQQQWLFEQQLWLLLPTVLLPCARSLLSPNGQPLLQQHRLVTSCVLSLLHSSRVVLDESAMELQEYSTLGGHAAPLPAAWVQELVGGGGGGAAAGRPAAVPAPSCSHRNSSSNTRSHS